MPLYHFDISPDSKRQVIDLANDEAAWHEARAICRDLSRDIIDAFDTDPEWQIEVADAANKPLFRFRMLSERLHTK